MKHTLDSNWIKGIAITAMTIDHIAWTLFPGYPCDVIPLLMHILGRLTCPIMCYFIAEGFHHTSSRNKYTVRLFAFAFISHFAYVFASADFACWKQFLPFYDGSILDQTSIMWPLAWGLVMLRIAHSQRIGKKLQIVLVLLICLITLPGDWSCVASLCILAFGTNRGNFKKQMLWMVFYTAIYAAVYFFAIDRLYGLIQMAVVLAIPVLRMYNGERGKNGRINRIMKWVFYFYYPAHLFILGWIQHLR